MTQECLLYASKAFDRVHHGLLFQKLLKRGLPSPIINFRLHWYCTQSMRVQWSPITNCLSSCFSVTSGVRQGGILSPFLFAVWMDYWMSYLRLVLAVIGVGCLVVHFAMLMTSFCWHHDCAFALRTMLSICSSFASSHGLVFNTDNPQLICFKTSFHTLPDDVIHFNDVQLSFSDSVVHLGHLLSYDLSDKIIRVIKDVNRKANLVLYTFRYVEPFVLIYLIRCTVFLYMDVYYDLSHLLSLQVSINKILRKIWHLPRTSHTSIVLSTARISFLYPLSFF